MKEQQVCACGEHESCVSPDNPNCARLLRAPQNEAEPQPWRVDLSCCGRDGGTYFFPTWEEADAFRNSYTSGPGVNPQGYSAHDSADGHRRAGIITGPQPQPTSEEREEAAKGLDELARRFSDDNMGCDSATCRIAARLLRAPQQQTRGEVVVTKNDRGQIVGVTRQDEDGQILSVIATSAPQQQAEPISQDVIAFLNGSAPLDGVWFGDKHPTERGAFWWRKYLSRKDQR